MSATASRQRRPQRQRSYSEVRFVSVPAPVPKPPKLYAEPGDLTGGVAGVHRVLARQGGRLLIEDASGLRFVISRNRTARGSAWAVREAG
jgi:hypothetical protein